MKNFQKSLKNGQKEFLKYLILFPDLIGKKANEKSFIYTANYFIYFN